VAESACEKDDCCGEKQSDQSGAYCCHSLPEAFVANTHQRTTHGDDSASEQQRYRHEHLADDHVVEMLAVL
jgi:hypothetical protein